MKKLTMLSTWVIILMCSIYFLGFRAPSNSRSKLILNSCTAATPFGAIGSINCPIGQPPNCSADMFKLKCDCSGDVTNAQLSLAENNKLDTLIKASLTFSTKAGKLFAANLKLHKTAIIDGDWTAYLTSAKEMEQVYNKKLSRSERASINNILLRGN